MEECRIGKDLERKEGEVFKVGQEVRAISGKRRNNYRTEGYFRTEGYLGSVDDEVVRLLDMNFNLF